MSWHVAAYTASLGSVTDTDTPASTPEDVLTVLNGHFVLRKMMKLIGAYAGGGTTTRARLDSPTLRYYGNPLIRPFDNVTVPANNYNFDPVWPNPMELPPGEELAVQWTTSGVGPTRVFAFIFLTDGLQPVSGGTIYPVRATATGTAVANTWTTVGNPIVMQQAFPTGAFEMVFSEVQSTTGIAHRWIFDEQLNRPGFISNAVLANRQPYWLMDCPWGVMGRFINTALPRLQAWCTAADASFEIAMYVRPLGRNISGIVPQGQPYLAG